MYIVHIAWLYVALMMSVTEATSPQGSVLGGLITFVLYGLLPLGLLTYILGTPGRKRRLREQAMQASPTSAAEQSPTPAAEGAEPAASKETAETPKPAAPEDAVATAPKHLSSP